MINKFNWLTIIRNAFSKIAHSLSIALWNKARFFFFVLELFPSVLGKISRRKKLDEVCLTQIYFNVSYEMPLTPC